jgi:hypothetical protein
MNMTRMAANRVQRMLALDWSRVALAAQELVAEKTKEQLHIIVKKGKNSSLLLRMENMQNIRPLHKR